MRVIQIIQTLRTGDGCGNDVQGVKRFLDSLGIENYIYAADIDKRLEKIARPFKKIKKLKITSNDIVIYSYAAYSSIINDVIALNCKKILRYQNITPPQFFAQFDKNSARICELGLQDIARKVNMFDEAMPASEFSANDLRNMGFTKPIHVFPCAIPFEDFDNNINEDLLKTLESDGKKTIIYTGRIVPNKCIHDLIRCFAFYKANINEQAKLILVGGYNEDDLYYQSLIKYIADIKVSDVIFTGRASFKDIKTYYKAADLYLCLSKHEGYCIPLVEAMLYRVPILAFDAGSVSTTLRDGGILTKTNDPKVVAEQIDILLNDESLREQIKAQQEIELSKVNDKSLTDLLKEIILK